MSILEKDFIVTRVDQVYNKSLKLTQEGIGTTSISLCSEKENTVLSIPLWEAGSEVDIKLGLLLYYRNYKGYAEGDFGSGVKLNLYSNITKEGNIYCIADSGLIRDFYELSTTNENKYNALTNKYLIASGSDYILYDKDGNKVCYSGLNKKYPSYIESANGNKISLTLTSDGYLSEITNNRDLKVVFTYDANKFITMIKFYRYNTTYEEIYRIGFTYTTKQLNGTTYGYITKIERGCNRYFERYAIHISEKETGIEVQKGMTNEKFIYVDTDASFKVQYGVNGKRYMNIYYLNPFNTKVIDDLGNITYYGFDANLFPIYECNEKGYIKSYNLGIDYKSVGVSNVYSINPSFLGDNLLSDPYNSGIVKWHCNSTNVKIEKIEDNETEYNNITSPTSGDDKYNPNMLYGIIGNEVIQVEKLNHLITQDVLLYFEENISGKANEMLIFGYWLCPYLDLYNKINEFEIAQVTLKLLDSNNNLVCKKEKSINRKSITLYDCKWNRYYRDWMYIADYIEPTNDYTKVRVEVKMLSESGEYRVARLTGFTLRKKSYGTYIKVNETGKIEEYQNSVVSYDETFKETDDMKIEALNSYTFETKKDSKNRVEGTYNVLGSMATTEYNSVSNIKKKTISLHGSSLYSEVLNEYNSTPEQTKDEFVTKSIDTDGSNETYDWNKTRKTTNYVKLDTSLKKLFTFDPSYRKRKILFDQNNTSLTTHTLTYEESDNIKTLLTPNKLYTFSYNEDNKLVSVKVSKNSTSTSKELFSYGYNNAGFLYNEKYGTNGDEYNYTYTKTGKVSIIKEKARNEAEKSVAYFEYDGLDRLKTVSNGKHLLVEEFTYDEGNNVASVKKYNDSEVKQFEKNVIYDNNNSVSETIIKVKDRYEFISHSGIENSLSVDNRSKLFNLKYTNTSKKRPIATCLFNGVSNDVTYFYGKKESPLVYTYKALSGKSILRTTDNGKWCIDNGSVQESLSYKIDTNTSTYPKMTIGMYFKVSGSVSGTLFSIGKTNDNYYVIGVINGRTLTISVKSKNNAYDDLKFTSKINLNEWNYVSFALTTKKVGNLKNMDYEVILNGESLSKSYLDVDFEFASANNILYVGTNSNNNNRLNAKIGPIMFTKGAYMYKTEVDEFKQKLDLLLEEIEGSVHFNNKELHEETVFIQMNAALEGMYPLRKDLRSANGGYPLEYSMIDNGICNKSNQFILNEDVSKRVYNAIGSKLVYRMLSGTIQSIIMNICLYDLNYQNRYLFETKAGSSNGFGAYINENNAIEITMLNQTITTDVVIDDNVFTKLHFQWTKNSGQNISYSVKIYKNETIAYSGTVQTNEAIESEKVYIGTNANGNSPLYGQIEMLAYDNQLVTQTASKKIYSITRSKDYNCLGLLLEESLTKQNKFITIKNEYETINNKLTGRVSKQTVKCNDTEEVYDYTYNKSEKTIEEKKNNSINKKYFYDVRGYLIKENINSLDKCIEYTYDKNGNITKKKETKISDGTVINTQNYNYMQDIWQDLLIDDNGENYEDTFIGNPTNLLGYNFVWFANRVKEITKGDIREELEYNYDGTLKTRKTYKNNTLEKQLKYYYDDGKLIYEEGNEKLYFMYDKDEIVGLKYSGKTYYYVKDLFGTITRICDEEGNIVVEYEYDAYGNVQEIKGTQKEILGKINPIIYKGYYYDSNVELYYCNTRYYNPKICRFISPDGVTYLNPESINGLNLYTYANNNPISFLYNKHNNNRSINIQNNLLNYRNLSNNYIGIGNLNVTTSAELDLEWLAFGIDMSTKIYGLYTAASNLVNHIKFFSKNVSAFKDEMTMIGASMKDGVLAFNQFNWNLGKSDVIGIVLNVGLDIYDSVHRGVSSEGILLGATMTAVKGVTLIYLNKGIIYGTTALGSLICPGVGTVIGYVAGGVICLFVDLFVSDKIDDLIDENIE